MYNKGPWLSTAIDSFLSQKVHAPFEILLIDDASTDNSREIIETYQQKFPGIIRTFFHETNQGISATWVEVCQEAKGQWIARCDGDDFWLDNQKLEKQLAFLEKHSDSKWCSCDFDIYSEDGRLVQKSGFENHIIPLADTYEKMLATRGFTMSSTWLVDRQLMLRINEKLDLATSDDTFNLQLDLFQQTTLAYLPEPMVAYRINQGSDSRPKSRDALNARFDKLLKTQLDYLDYYPSADYKEMVSILLNRVNDFEKELAQRDYIHSQITEQTVTIYYSVNDLPFDQQHILQFQLQYRDSIDFQLPSNTTRIRIDLSEIASFYKDISLLETKYQTKLLPDVTNGIQVKNYVFFTKNDPQLVYDIRHLDSLNFTLDYEMFNVDKSEADDFITKLLAPEFQESYQEANQLMKQTILYDNVKSERDRYKQELEEMVVRYNSVTHSRRWTIPTKIINLLRRRK